MDWKRFGILLGLGLLIVLAVGIALPLLPPSEFQCTQWFYCTRCGALLRVAETGTLRPRAVLSRKQSLSDSRLSAWYKRHFGEACDHDWSLCDSSYESFASAFGLWRQRSVSEYGSGYSSPLVSLSIYDRVTLESLAARDLEAAGTFVRRYLPPPHRGGAAPGPEDDLSVGGTRYVHPKRVRDAKKPGASPADLARVRYVGLWYYSDGDVAISLRIDIDRHAIRYEREQPGQSYERPSSPKMLAAVAAPVLQSRLFAEPEQPFGAATPYSFYVVLHDGTWVERHATEAELRPDGKSASLRAWLDCARHGFDRIEQPREGRLEP